MKKSLGSGYSEKIDTKCLEWFSQAGNQNITLSGPIIKAKALEFSKNLGIDNFRASNGWLDRWRTRNNIKFKCISGEAADVDKATVDQFLEKLPSLLMQYRPEDIYNVDETGLFFRALPEKTMAHRFDKCSGGKLSKERLTILLCANLAGEKEKLWVIGKAARPRAFKNIKIKDLPVLWHSNKKAWMTSSIMLEWLHDFDRKMKRERRKIILFLDNAGSHPKNIRLDNIQLLFLPPNTTSVCQPLDQGVIQNFKFHYRKLIIKHIISKIDEEKTASELVKSINVLEAVYFINSAWKSVSAGAIKLCFQKAGFVKQRQDEFDLEDDLPLVTLSKSFSHHIEQNISKILDIDEHTLSSYTDFDNFLCTEEPVNTDSPIVQLPVNVVSSSEEEEEHDLPEYESNIKSIPEALKVLQSLKLFAKGEYEVFEQIKNVESYYQDLFLKQNAQKSHQTTISSYFKNI